MTIYERASSPTLTSMQLSSRMRNYGPFAATQIRIFAVLEIFPVMFAALRWWSKFRAPPDTQAAICLSGV